MTKFFEVTTAQPSAPPARVNMRQLIALLGSWKIGQVVRIKRVL